LCTNSFPVEDVECLVEKLSRLGVRSKIQPDVKEQPTILLEKDTFSVFLDGVKPYIPWECMSHKVVEVAENATG